MSTLLVNGSILDSSGRRSGWLLIEGKKFTQTGLSTEKPPAAKRTVDLSGRVVTPGFLDLHSHGGGGFHFEGDEESISSALRVHRLSGTTRSVISLVAAPVAKMCESLTLIKSMAKDDSSILGVHLEGPFLSKNNRGAHSEEFLCEPTPEIIEALLEAGRGTLRQVTIAPELPGSCDAIRRFVEAGVIVAIGHTNATSEETVQALDAGATLLTHAFNAMPGIHHRDPGPIIPILERKEVTIELILDGVHVDPSMARLLFRCAPNRIALVTDAMAAAGAQDGSFKLGSLDVEVIDGIAREKGSGVLAGSTLTQDQALRNALNLALIDEVSAVRALTSTPAQALGCHHLYGKLTPGFVADAVVLDTKWKVEQVWLSGEQIMSAKNLNC